MKKLHRFIAIQQKSNVQTLSKIHFFFNINNKVPKNCVLEKSPINYAGMYFLKNFQNSRRKALRSDSFFPAEYEYFSNFFPGTMKFSKKNMLKVSKSP